MVQRTRLRVGVLLCAVLAACSGPSCSDPAKTYVVYATGSNGGSSAGTSPGAGGSGGSVGGTAPSAGGSVGGTAPGAGGSTAGTSGAGGSVGGVVLDQTGNPVYDLLGSYKDWLSSAGDPTTRLNEDRALADNIVTWQMPHGGFFKRDKSFYSVAWNGSAARSDWLGDDGGEIGTIDNDGTVIELLFLADVYGRSGDSTHRDSARMALDFLLAMQYPSGGFPQVYPARAGGSYSNHVTFNDNAMVRVLLLFDQAAKLVPPLGQDLFTPEQLGRLPGAIAGGIDYIVSSQIVQNGAPTVWCAQHDETTYAPVGARSYELPSKSGSESAGVVAFLMTQPQSPEIATSVQAALFWYDSDAVKVPNTAYVSRPAGSTDDNYNPIQPQPGSTMWYRFYDLASDVGFFSGRLPTDNPPGVGKKYDIMEIEAERRYGYSWGGSWGTRLLDYAASVGY
jgi:PelA/Pel-15E family pectate lyase